MYNGFQFLRRIFHQGIPWHIIGLGDGAQCINGSAAHDKGFLPSGNFFELPEVYGLGQIFQSLFVFNDMIEQRFLLDTHVHRHQADGIDGFLGQFKRRPDRLSSPADQTWMRLKWNPAALAYTLLLPYYAAL